MEYSTNKRKHVRVKVSLPAGFGVLIPEETFSPVRHDATVSDLSERGAMVETSLDDTSQTALLQKLRFCSIQFNDIEGLPSRIVGRAVWIQPFMAEDGTKRYKIGIFFEDCPEAMSEQLRSFTEKLAKEQGISA